MMKIMSTLLALLLLLYPMAAELCRAQTAPARTTAAILDLEARGLSETESGALSDRLRSEMFYTGAFDMMERGKMQELLTEQGFQQSGACNTNACAMEVGQLIGVQKMIAGSLGKVGRTYSVILRMVDVRTGRVEQSVTQDYTGEIDKLLTEVMRSIANKMAAAVRSGQPRLAKGALPGPASEGRPFYKKWWFWGGIGLLGAGGAAAALLGGGSTTSDTPPTVESLPLPPNPPLAPGLAGGGDR